MIPLCIWENEESIHKLGCVLVLTMKSLTHTAVVTGFDMKTNVHTGIPGWDSSRQEAWVTVFRPLPYNGPQHRNGDATSQCESFQLRRGHAPPHWKQTIEGTSHCQTKPIASSSPSGKRSARRTQLLQISMQGCFTDESEGAWVTSSFQATRVNGNTCLHGYHFALHIILSCSSAYAFQERPWNQLTVNYLYQQVLQSVAQTLLHEGHLVLSRLCPRHVYK